MPYCPNCKYEYQAGKAVCPDCNIPLLDKLPTAAPAGAVVPDDSWVGVCGVRSNTKAEMAKGALDSNNIPSVLISSQFSAYGKDLDMVLPFTVSSKGGTIILVPREYADEAGIIVEAVLGDDCIDLSDGKIG